MSLLIAVKGITAISQIEIDSDKDWNGKEISNIQAIIAGMQQGDLVYYGGSALARLPAASSGQNLQCQGSGRNPKWS
jgi:hypothetical protein